MHGHEGASALIALLLFVGLVAAIPTYYGGTHPPLGYADVILDSNTMMFHTWGAWTQDEADTLHYLADHGIRINMIFQPEVVEPNSLVLDYYYNTTLLQLLDDSIDTMFELVDENDLGPGINPDKVYSITIGDEEPEGLYPYGLQYAPDERVASYNSTFHSETGFWLKGLHDMNRTERIVWEEWLGSKITWLLNHIYDRCKGNWPNIRVFQFLFSYRYAFPYELKADGFVIDWYLSEHGGMYRDNPWSIYFMVRRYKTWFQDKPLYLWLWGEEHENQGLNESLEHMRRNAWVAALSGVSGIGWFNWDWEKGWLWERTDIDGRLLQLYTSRLNAELAKFPVLNSSPPVLFINERHTTTPCPELGLLTEYDVLDPRSLARIEVNLSQYSLIITHEYMFPSEAIQKLNDYVRRGGNLIHLRGLGAQTNIYENGTRTPLFLVEQNATMHQRSRHHVRVNITTPNALQFSGSFDIWNYVGFEMDVDNASGNYHGIGEFYAIDDFGNATPIDNYPLLLYHNASNPDEGWILYWGLVEAFDNDSPDPASPSYRQYLYDLYTSIARAFARNFLSMNTSISDDSTANLLVTQGLIESNVVMAGVSNFMINASMVHIPEDKNMDYVIDLTRYNLTDGTYWVFSLDQNASLGQFESANGFLTIPLFVPANGTRLLLISPSPLEPEFWIDVFPPVPSENEVTTTGTTTTTTTDTTTTTTTTTVTTSTSETTTQTPTSETSATSPETTTTNGSLGTLGYLGVGALAALVIIAVMVVFQTKRGR
ncbi:MAG: hypothetical protein ACTSYX_06425 [Candidatus Thorarchaeota archaeon]